MDLSIHPKLKEKAGNVYIGAIQCSVKVTPHEEELWKEIALLLNRLTSEVALDTVAQISEIRGIREAYKALGKEPGRYRSSSEALLRRTLQGKGLYQVNTVVDINNLVSLETHYPVCSFDRAMIYPPVTFTIGEPHQSYTGIGKGEINIGELPVFSDRSGPFGSPTSDSISTRITEDTTDLLFLIVSLTGRKGLEPALHRATALLVTYADAQDLETAIID